MDAGDATGAIRSCFSELGDHALRPLEERLVALDLRLRRQRLPPMRSFWAATCSSWRSLRCRCPSPGHRAGVIDFSAAALADPAVDFAGMLSWAGWNGVDDVARFYEGPLGPHFEERVEFAYWTLPLGWLAFAVNRENEPMVGRARSELSVRMQRAGVMPAG